MHRKTRAIELSPVQITQVIAALRLQIKALYQQESDDPDSGAGNDVLIAESALRAVVKIADEADGEDFPNARRPE